MFQTLRVGFPTLFILLIEVNLSFPFLSFPSSTFTDDTILYQNVFHIKREIIIYHIALSYGNNYTGCNQINNLNILRIKDKSFTTRK